MKGSEGEGHQDDNDQNCGVVSGSFLFSVDEAGESSSNEQESYGCYVMDTKSGGDCSRDSDGVGGYEEKEPSCGCPDLEHWIRCWLRDFGDGLLFA